MDINLFHAQMRPVDINYSGTEMKTLLVLFGETLCNHMTKLSSLYQISRKKRILLFLFSQHQHWMCELQEVGMRFFFSQYTKVFVSGIWWHRYVKVLSASSLRMQDYFCILLCLYKHFFKCDAAVTGTTCTATVHANVLRWLAQSPLKYEVLSDFFSWSNPLILYTWQTHTVQYQNVWN